METTNTTTNTAPYVDPDGYPSWQPDPEVRSNDAISRRVRSAKAIRQAKANLIAAENAVVDARARLFALIDDLEEETLEVASRAYVRF